MSSTLMSIGMRAMFANTAQLDVTGHNIANANVAGYSRQSVQLATAPGQFTGVGFFGKGVNVVNVTRAHDEFLTMQARAARSVAASDDARLVQLSGLEDVFPPGEKGLGYAMGDFFAAMVDLGNAPADTSARQAALARAAEVADRFDEASDRIDVLAAGVRTDLENSAATVTELARQVAALNEQIAATRGLPQQPNDLLDRRDELISQLGDFLDVSTMLADDGTMSVFTAGGQRLVLGNESSQLVARPDAADSSRMSLAMVNRGQSLPVDETMLTGGSIAGLLRFQNDDLVDARNQLGQMAAAFAGRVNEAQAMGLDLNEDHGGAIFATGAPQALPNANNRKDASGNFLAEVSLEITDASLLRASDYDLRPDPDNPGGYTLTRLSDNVDIALSDADGDGVWTTDPDQGFSVTIGTPAPQAGESFLLQPVGRAASDMRRVLDDPDGLAAALPFQAAMGTANTGTATVDGVRMTGDPADRDVTTELTFGAVDAEGNVPFTWTNSDGSSGSGTWEPGEPIELNGVAVTLNGAPASGDKLAINPTVHADTDNGNALAMSRLADESFVGRTRDSDGHYTGGATVTDAYADTMADVGVRVQSARTAAGISATAATQAMKAIHERTGVDLDEEAARLIQFQQGYQAAAKVLQVAQSVFDTMIQLGR